LGKIVVDDHIDCEVIHGCDEDEVFVSIAILVVSEAVWIDGIDVASILLLQAMQLLVLLIETQLAICQDIVSG